MDIYKAATTSRRGTRLPSGRRMSHQLSSFLAISASTLGVVVPKNASLPQDTWRVLRASSLALSHTHKDIFGNLAAGPINSPSGFLLVLGTAEFPTSAGIGSNYLGFSPRVLHHQAYYFTDPTSEGAFIDSFWCICLSPTHSLRTLVVTITEASFTSD